MQQGTAHVKPGDHATVREAKVNESVNEYFQIIVKKKELGKSLRHTVTKQV